MGLVPYFYWQAGSILADSFRLHIFLIFLRSKLAPSLRTGRDPLRILVAAFWPLYAVAAELRCRILRTRRLSVHANGCGGPRGRAAVGRAADVVVRGAAAGAAAVRPLRALQGEQGPEFGLAFFLRRLPVS